jgi:hypothetical protein
VVVCKGMVDLSSLEPWMDGYSIFDNMPANVLD